MMLFASANRDERAFDRPDAFDALAIRDVTWDFQGPVSTCASVGISPNSK